MSLLLPDRMKTVKVVVPIDYDRDIQRYLSSTNDVELIDVQKKTFDLNSYDHGPRLRELGDEFEKIIDHFDIKKRAPKKTVKIDDRNFKTVLQSIESLEENVLKKLNHNIDRTSLAEKELEKNKSTIEIAKNLIPFGFSFEDLADERPYFSILVGRMETKRVSRFKWNLDAITDGNYLLKESPLEGNHSFIAVGYLERYQEGINRLLVAYGFEKYSIPERITGSPEKVVKRSQENIKKLKERLTELQEEAEQLIKEHGAEILAYAEQISVEINYRKIDTILRKTSKNATFWGWVSKKSTKHLQKKVNKYTDDNALIEFSSPVFEETEYPSKTSVPKTIRVYDGLVNTYGAPGYNEYNPALLMAIFYPIIFGIMFADVGHGLLFALLGVYGLTLQNKKLDPSTGFGDELKSYFKGGAWLMIASGLVSMVWGVLFGSYFGVTHYTAPDLVPEALWFSPEHGPVAYSPTTSVVTLMLELSLLVGMIHMTVGYILRLATNIRHKHFLEAILVTGMLIIFHWTLYILVFTFGPDFMTWFGWNNSGTFDMAILSIGGQPIQFFRVNHALLLFAGGFVLPLIIMAVFLGVGHGMDGIAEFIELLLATISNTVSYGRIFAMNSVHGALSHIFTLTMFTGEEFGVINIIGALVGSLVIVAIEGLFSFIQTLRLHWVEFFGKIGYHGTGTKFSPMVFERLYSTTTY